MSYDDKKIRKRNRSRSRSTSRDDKRRYKEKSKRSDRERDRDRDRDRERERDRDRDRDRERERSNERDRKSSRKDRDEQDKKHTSNNSTNNNFEEKEKNKLNDGVSKATTLTSEKVLSVERDAEEKEAEQAALEEEMRKRRERVKAWQLEKAARLAAELQQNGNNNNNNDNDNNSNIESKVGINQERLNIDQNLNGNGNENNNNENENEGNNKLIEDNGNNLDDKNKLDVDNKHSTSHWTLEDDNDDSEEDYPSNTMELEKNNNFIESEDIKLLGPLKQKILENEEISLPFSSPTSFSRPRSGSGTLSISVTTPTKSLNLLPSSPLVEKNSASIDINIKKPATSRFSKLSQSSSTPNIDSNNILSSSSSSSILSSLPIQITTSTISINEPEVDPLDAFMASLYDSGDVIEQNSFNTVSTPTTSNNNNNSKRVNPFGSNFITLDQIVGKPLGNDNENENDNDDTKSVQEWESEISFSPAPSSQQQQQQQQMENVDIDEEKEERERREFLEALKASVQKDLGEEFNNDSQQTKIEKGKISEEFGRVFGGEGDMIDESEVEAKKKSVLELLEEAKRGKELKPIDHSQIEYIPFRKNLYIVPRALAKLAPEEISIIRETLQIKVRGKGCPAPVENWDQCGLSERILSIIHKHNFSAPFSIQKQAIPAIMCGRDIIAVAKTGSGKTLAFLLPLFRHILDQPPLRDGEGPIGLIMAPARELAFQITNEAKKFTKALGLRVACIYGGAGVADQIADLKRGAEIVVCTPGRMIDILCMQAGKLVTLKRVTFVVMDEADRMFDMGFEPQIRMIIQNVRPDRQTVLFSATFPKQIEKLAKSILRLPLEIVVGERTTANKDITQYVEVHEEEEKYMRLLQLLGLWYERGSILIFVDKQEKCDQLFQDLLKSGYPCLSLHGGKDQLDRDHTLHEFKTGIKTVMVATSVAGRGLDVPEIICVINYNCPNHVEDYVHRVGRTGRAGRKGVAYTFLLPTEDQYAPMMKTILEKAEQSVPKEIEDMLILFKEKVARGEAHWIGNGFIGKGYKFDASEMNEAQKLASMQRRAYEIEQGIISEKGDDDVVIDDDDFYADVDGSNNNNDNNNNNGGGDVESKSNDMLITSTSSSIPLQITDGIIGTSSSSSSSSLVTTSIPSLTSSLTSISTSTATAASTLSSLSSLSATISTSGDTPLERARALALSLGINRTTTGVGGVGVGVGNGTPITPNSIPGMTSMPVLPPPPVTADGKIDTKAALNRAKLIAAQMSGKGMTVTSNEGQTSSELHFMEEFEINDYPPLARRKVTQKNVLDEITYRTSVAIIARGSYIPPGKKLEVGERKLYLLIEGSTEMQVKQAKMEIQRLLEEETIKMGSVSLSNYGKYGII